jgi:hypothetical protein
MKPRVFIGSSKEGLDYLNIVVNQLEGIVDFFIWTDPNVFKPNKGILETLIKQAKLSDFAILIATKDDITISPNRKTKRLTARDNVIFEHGLFMGATSIERAFLLVHEEAGLPSDLNGTGSLTFSEKPGTYNYIDEVCKNLKNHILQVSNQSELGFVPSTALAMGYFNGFVKNVCESLGKQGLAIVEGKEVGVKSYRMNIVLPDDIDVNGVSDFKIKYNKVNALQKASTVIIPNMSGRDYPFNFRVDPTLPDFSSEVDLHIYDVPTTLDTILEAISLYFPSTFIGGNEEREHLEKRELRNFANVLRYYIGKNSWTRDHVFIEEGVTV